MEITRHALYMNWWLLVASLVYYLLIFFMLNIRVYQCFNYISTINIYQYLSSSANWLCLYPVLVSSVRLRMSKGKQQTLLISFPCNKRRKSTKTWPYDPETWNDWPRQCFKVLHTPLSSSYIQPSLQQSTPYTVTASVKGLSSYLPRAGSLSL